MNQHVILCGLGELGFRTLERLRALGDEVVVIDPAPRPDFERMLAGWQVALVRDTGRSALALRDAGILTARALIAVAGDDLENLAIALAAREENPDVRLVVRLFNPRIVEKVQREIKHCRVLDVAALAAPIFAYAGSHQDVAHCLDVPGGRFLLHHWSGLGPPRARRLAIRHAAALVHSGQGKVAYSFSVGDWALLPDAGAVAGPDDVVFGLTAVEDGPFTPEIGWRRTARHRGRRLRRLGMAIGQSRLTPILMLLVGVMFISVHMFHLELGLTWLQSLYFVVTIMTTTGFGDISVKDAAPIALVYVIGLMLVGSASLATLYAVITDALLSVRLGTLFRRQSIPSRGHFVICGLGTVGFRIAEELVRRGQPCVAIERQANSRLQEQARRMGVPVVRSQDIYTTIREVNVDEAACVLTVTDDDALNLELALIVQSTNPRARVVARIFDPALARMLERAFGIDMARSPSAIAAPAFAVAAYGDDLLDAFDLADTLWCVGTVSLGDGHPFVGSRAVDLVKRQILVLTWRGKDGEWEASNDDRILAHAETIVVLTPHERWLGLQHLILT